MQGTTRYSCPFHVPDPEDAFLQLVGWIPLNEILKTAQIDVLFRFVKLYNGDTSLSALACVIEILSKNYVPAELTEFLKHIFHHSLLILMQLTSTNLKHLDEGYAPQEMFLTHDRFLNRFTQFLNLFIVNHIRRIEFSTVSFPTIEFLSVLFKYSFIQPSIEGQLACLEIWTAFLDFLISLKEEKTPVHPKYMNGLLAFFTEVLKTVQFSLNAQKLSTLSTEIAKGEEEV